MSKIKGGIKFGIIGCGRIAYRHIEAIQQNKYARLVALCDLNLERARERNAGVNVAVYRDYNEMLEKEDIDVVSIMTPSGMHAEHAVDVMDNYKKHVLIEKPMCLRVEDGFKLIEAAKRNNVKLFPVHQNRFNKAIQKVKTTIDKGGFGKISLATIRVRWSRCQAYYNRDPWRGTWALDGGVLSSQAIHHVDLLRWLAGDIMSISAIAKTQFVDVEVEDTACAWIRFQNGALGMIEATTTARPENKDLEASLSILGEHGAAIVEGTAVNRLTTWTLNKINLDDYSENPPNVYGYGHNYIIDNIVDVLLREAPVLVMPEDVLQTAKFLSAIYKSIESNGKEVYMKDNPVSDRFGVIGRESDKIADLYRTKMVLKKQ
jgi:UDP-N-acetyl-2-amino-2-deoxyglucuronate dehydrogenase